MSRFGIAIIIFLAVFASQAQSGRKGSGEAGALSDAVRELDELTIEQMYTMAVNYARDKFTELEQKNAPYNEAVHRRILQEQKQLAAKYASASSARPGLNGIDLYYLGRLHWMATNADDAAAAFEAFLKTPSGDYDDMKQTARSVVVVMAAEKGEFAKSEAALAEYLTSKPVRMSELAKMEKQLAFSYGLENRYDLAAPHAEAAFDATRTLLFEDNSRARALSQFLDAGVTVLNIEKELGRRDKVESILDTLEKYGAIVESHSIYFRSIDERIKYWIETGRKQEALSFYSDAFKRLEKAFPDRSLRAEVESKLKKRERHYELLGEPAPDLVSVVAWLPAGSTNIRALKGKVILLDFWATWCGPCFEAFPGLIDWHNRLEDKGLAIIGVTRYYGEVDGKKADEASELRYLKEFKEKEGLPYPFAVANDQSNQIHFGALGIPTTVLVDRRGIIRYVETGTSENREREVREMIGKLLAEN